MRSWPQSRTGRMRQAEVGEKFQRGRTEEEKAGKMMRKKGRVGMKQRKSILINLIRLEQEEKQTNKDGEK